MFEGSFEVLDDFLSENIWVGNIVGLLGAFVSELEDTEAGLVPVLAPSKIGLLPFSPL